MKTPVTLSQLPKAQKAITTTPAVSAQPTNPNPMKTSTPTLETENNILNPQETISALKNAFIGGCQLALKIDILHQYIAIAIDSDGSKNTLLHLVVKGGGLKFTPKELLTFQNLTVKNADGVTAFDLAWENNPQQLLGIKLPDNYRSRVGDQWWTLNEMFITCVTESFASALPDSEIVRIAAYYGFIFALRDEYLKEDLFITPHPDRAMAIQEAAVAGHLDQVPKKFLTEKNLMLVHETRAALSLAYDCGNLDQLLGIELSQRCKPIVGNEWWERNQNFLTAKASPVIVPATEREIELF